MLKQRAPWLAFPQAWYSRSWRACPPPTEVTSSGWWKVLVVILLFHWWGAVLAVLLLSFVSPISRTVRIHLPLRLLAGHCMLCSLVFASPHFSCAKPACTPRLRSCDPAVYLHWFICSPLPFEPLNSSALGNVQFIALVTKYNFIGLWTWLLIQSVSLLGGSETVPLPLCVFDGW